KAISITDFLKDAVNSIVTAGAGFGKTTFMHSIFKRMATSTSFVPLLFTLRETDEVTALEEFAERASTLAKKLQGKRLLVLADGYDEITTDARQRVSTLLNKLSIEKTANYILTCRDHYDIYKLNDVRRVHVAEFARTDQLTFMQKYFQICERRDLDATAVENIY